MTPKCLASLSRFRMKVVRKVVISLTVGLPVMQSGLTDLQAGGPTDVWIEMLSSKRFVDRQRATASLTKLGQKSIAPLRTAAGQTDVEVGRRALDVLASLLRSNDEAVAARARRTLQTMARSDNERVARRASFVLVRENRRLQDGVIDLFEQLGGKVTGDVQIDLSESRITNASLAQVMVFSESLKILALPHTHISDHGLAPVSELTNLEVLNLHHTRLRGPGLVHLANLGELVQLDLRGTKLSDVGLEHLKNLAKLEMLYLSQTPLTDVGLNKLPNLPKLKHLIIRETKVTHAAVERLLKRMPRVKVVR